MRLCIDLHNHSCLSPCADNDMIPAVMVIEALDKGIDILAITDHNSARNAGAFAEACGIAGLCPVFGIEVTTAEEVHVLALFPTVGDVLDFGSFIEFLLPRIQNRPDLLGDQLIVDLAGNVTGQFAASLFGAADITFENLVEEILSRDGLAIPAHIDRPSNSVSSNLGFLPPMSYSAVESIRIPPPLCVHDAAVVQGSDAHSVRHVGRRCCWIEAQDRSFQSLKEALGQKLVYYRI